MALRKLAKGPPPGETAVTEVRIEAVAATLRDFSFRNGETLRDFAKAWGVSLHRVHEISAIASRRVRAEVTDPDRVAAKGFAMIERIATDAMVDVDKDGNNAGHRAIALRAVDTWMKNSGVAAPTKQSITTSSDLASLTDEQLEARKNEIIARLTAKSGSK